MNFYQKDQINELSIEKAFDDSLVITFFPLLETLYSCPGAKVEEKDGVINIRFVRCRVNAECSIDVTATHRVDSPGSYTIAIPTADKPIKIDFHTETQQIWPKR